MKRLVLATAAISLLAVPVAQAQSRGQFGAPDHRYEQPYVKKGHDLRRGHGGDYKVIRKKPKGHHWTRGSAATSCATGTATGCASRPAASIGCASATTTCSSASPPA